MENWSFAESSHCKLATEGGYYGRYNIGKEWFSDYMRWRKFPLKNVKNVKKFLENDYNNCYIAYYSCWLFTNKLGYSYRDFFQIWLWGMGNFKKGHWSYKYEKKIYKKIKYAKNLSKD